LGFGYGEDLLINNGNTEHFFSKLITEILTTRINFFKL